MFESRGESSWGGNMFLNKNSDPYGALEAGELGADAGAFAEKTVRQGFIRKVFGASLASQ